ncbi:glycosyltransferase [Hydrogenophaga sp. RWCD_12]|uniref:glycosyltransferase n=1 Tax=Hydrogenophaga sp. RWCD_12 TaxID=3391190 RepID=UPI003984CD1E
MRLSAADFPFGNLFRPKRKLIENVSVIVLTQDSETRLPLLLESLAGYFSEIVVGVDTKSSDGTLAAARKLAGKVVSIDNPAGTVEATIEQLASICSNEWVLRLDDDELISHGLLRFIEQHLEFLSVEAIGIHRKWCRVNLAGAHLEYSTNPLYGYDWQWRLFRKFSVGYCKDFHTPGICFRTETKAPLDGFIVHLDWIYRDFGYRKSKVARYEAISAGKGHGAYYLYELDSMHRSCFAPLFLSEFDEVARRLLPIQEKSDLVSAELLKHEKY